MDIDDDNYDPLDPTSRRQVDQLLNRRDIEIRKREGRVAGAFIDGLDDVDDAASPAPVRRRRHIYDTEAIDEDSEIVKCKIIVKKTTYLFICSLR